MRTVLLLLLVSLLLASPLLAGPAPAPDPGDPANPGTPAAPTNTVPTRYVEKPAPPNASDSDVMETIETFLLSTLPDPESYEPLNWSGMVLFEEDESKAYRWGMRHTYRVSHPHYGVLYVDRIFFIAYDGRVESVIEYTGQPCIDCKW